nr:MAG TPA: portal [Caudoviricetes sp.]
MADVKKEIINRIALNVLNIGSVGDTTVEMTSELKYRIAKDITVNTAINSLIRGVTSRELIVKSEKTNDNANENDVKILEIQKRINKIKNKTGFLNNLCKAVFFGMSVHEIIYNEDYTIEKFEEIPFEIIKYRKESKNWYFVGNNGEVNITENPTKWLHSIYNQSIKNFSGETRFEAIAETYSEIEKVKQKLRGIIEKYGDTIITFAYDPDNSNEEVEATANELKKMYGKNILAIPIGNGKLADNVHFIKLSDLKTEIHSQLIEKYEQKIISNLLGGNLTVSNGEGKGSYALGEIHQEEKEKIEDEMATFIRDQLDEIIKIDAEFFGYEAEKYYISLEREEKELEKLEIDKKKQENRNLKMDEIVKLKQAGYELEESEMKEIFDYKTLKRIEQQSNQLEFEDKKLSIAERQIKIEEYINKAAKRFAEEQGGNLKKY